jgi:hypothetical protein
LIRGRGLGRHGGGDQQLVAGREVRQRNHGDRSIVPGDVTINGPDGIVCS